jgi:hypothetical protein
VLLQQQQARIRMQEQWAVAIQGRCGIRCLPLPALLPPWLPQVYRVTKPSGLEAQLQGTPAGLVPELRPYQRRAVAWMLGLEHGQHASAVTAPAPAAGSSAGQLTSHSYSSSVQQLLAGLLQPYSEWLSVLLLQPAVRAAGSRSGAAGGGVGAGLGVRQLFLHPVLGQLSAEAVQAPPVVPGGEGKLIG